MKELKKTEVKMNRRSGKASQHIAGVMEKKKIERKTVEKNRRILMKKLCFNLVSLLPSHHFDPNSSKEMLSQLDQLQQATNYIVQLRDRVHHLKEKKAELSSMFGLIRTANTERPSHVADSRYPITEVRDLGSCLEVIIISRLCKSFKLFQVLTVLEDEGVEVVGVNVATIGNKIYHTLHAKVKTPRVGMETSRIGGRLHELMSAVTPVMDDPMDYGCNTNAVTIHVLE